MKILKWFSLFFMSVFFAFIIGILVGWRVEEYFYPQNGEENIVTPLQEKSEPLVIRQEAMNVNEQVMDTSVNLESAIEVAGSDERIHADTVYVVIERNMDTDEEIEMVKHMPEMYLGMDREQFLAGMDEYEANPPLSELERGFVNLEVQSFSGSKVEVLMNYSYVKPSKSFYVVVYNGLVTVLLEDRETIYMHTAVEVLSLPETVQQELIQGMFVPDEESLYDFLENYTS